VTRSGLAMIGIGACLLMSGPCTGQAPRFDGIRIELRPNPRVVPADGQTAATVRADLRNSANRPVPDGTRVVFRIEGGSLGAGGGERRSAVTATTTGGSATVWATSTTVGTATVVAEVLTGAGRNQAQIYFTEEGAAPLQEARVVHVRGGWVGYAHELGFVEARTGERGAAELSYGSVKITGEVLQLGATDLIVRAIEATITVEGRSVSGRDLYYDLMSGQGVIRRLGEDGVERVCFDCYTMQEEPAEEDLPGSTFRLDQADTMTWSVAKSISVYPYKKIVLRNAAVYVDSDRLLKLPKYWIIAMPGYGGTTHSQMLSVNSDGEIGVDLPYVYSVTDTHTSSVKVQRGSSNGTIIARDDWSLAVEEAYEGDSARGVVTVAGLPREDWGFEWRDVRQLGQRSEVHVTAFSPDHKSAYLDTNMYRWADDHRVNLRAYWDRPQGVGDSYGASADWLTYNRPLGVWSASYRVGTGIGAGHVGSDDGGIVGEHQVYAALDFPRKRLGGRTTLRPSISNLFLWDTSGYRYESIRGELAMRQIISSEASMGLSYGAQYTTGDNARGYEHLLNLNASVYHGNRWQSSLMATYELQDADTYAYWLMDYYPDDKWRVGVGATYYDFGGEAYDDIELTLARRFSGREVGLRWSRESGKLTLEMGGFGGLLAF